ncbi:cytochrome p450 [Verticillium dahliae]
MCGKVAYQKLTVDLGLCYQFSVMITKLFSEQVTAVPLVAALFVLYLARTVIAWARLRQFTGPRWTGVSNIPHGKAALSEKCHEWYAKVSKEHGPIARIAPGILLTSSPEVWAHVNRQAGYKRSEWYYNACRVEYRRDNVFTQSDNVKHEQRRKQMAPGYSGRENPGLEASIDERLEDLLNLVRTKYISTPDRIVPMDLAKKVQFFTLDVISAVGLGKTFGMLAADKDVDSYLQSSEEGLAAANTAWALGASWLAQSPVLGRFIAPSPRDNNGFGKMMATCFRFVDERVARGDTDKRSDMLASFIRHGLRDDELKSEALEQIIAGSDTTAGAIRGALLLVMTNPRVYALLQKEIDAAVRDGRAPAVGNGLISQAQAKELPLLQAVVRESLRVRTPVANLFPRDVPAGGDTVVVDGERIALPGGVCIGYSAYAMHRDEALYGDDAQAFRPERWFEDDKDKLAAMVRTNDMVFGDGRFTCLGKPVAQMEMAKTIFELLRHFDVALIDPIKPWKTRNLLGLFAISDMWVQVMERS